MMMIDLLLFNYYYYNNKKKKLYIINLINIMIQYRCGVGAFYEVRANTKY